MFARSLCLALALLPGVPAVAATVTITVRDAAGQPLRDAVVSIESPATRPGTPPAFSYPLRVEQKNIQFNPYVLLVPKGAEVAFPNRDRVRHQVYSFSKPKKFELKLYGQEEDRTVLFDFPGTVALGCNIHDSMSGFIRVVDTPWAEKTDASGRASIAGVPAGPATIRVWHPRAVIKGNEFSAALPIVGDDIGKVITLKNALMVLPVALPRFRTIRTKLSVLYAGMFAVALTMVAIVAHLMATANVERAAISELATSNKVFERLWALKTRTLAGTADVLARDYGFREAVASGDEPTMRSALDNIRGRIGGGSAFVVGTEGSVVGGEPGALQDTVARFPAHLADGRQSAVVAAGGHVYHMVAAPILAPQEIGTVVFAIDVNAQEMRSLERLSSIPLTASVLRRDGDGWRPAAGLKTADATAIRTVIANRSGRARKVAIDGQSVFALASPLPAAGDRADAVLLLSYPEAAAMAPYRPLEFAILVAGLIGLVLVVFGSLRLASSIARPISALDRAARALEEGERTTVAVEGGDELANLARSFNAMSRGIADREDRIAHLAFHDSLTGLPNRVLFREQLDAGLRQAMRRETSVAVLCIDLDGFKGVNDTLGHPVGDQMLRHVGDLVAELSGEALVARLGGDEFAIILTEPERDRPRALSQAIVDRLRDPMTVVGHNIMTGASIGIAIGPDDGQDADTILKNADLALYRAKQEGRSGFRFFEPSLDAAARARRQLELDMREALTAGQFRLEFQPVLSLQSNHILGFEALLRWDHPSRGLVSPVEFIPVAEDTGLIIQIGEWVIQEACRHASSWPEDLRVAVNVSALQFRNPGLKGVIVQALARSNIAPQRLEIEMTESIFVEDSAATLTLLHSLRSLGIRIALDDFGTGYSSLSYLRSFPFDKIKIDRSFVTGIEGEQNAAAIVRAIVDLASALGMETTAEGVEDQRQMDELRNQGCGSMQGFLYSRPIAASAIASLLRDDRPETQAEAA